MTKRMILFHLALSVALGSGVCLSSATARAGELLVNGDFEDQPNIDPNVGWGPLTGDQIPGWTLAAGHYATIQQVPVDPPLAITV